MLCSAGNGRDDCLSGGASVCRGNVCVNGAAGECVRSDEVEVIVREVIWEKVVEAVRESQAGRSDEGNTTQKKWYAYTYHILLYDSASVIVVMLKRGKILVSQKVREITAQTLLKLLLASPLLPPPPLSHTLPHTHPPHTAPVYYQHIHN